MAIAALLCELALMAGAPLRICIVDMNTDSETASVRSLRKLIAGFFRSAEGRNPGLTCKQVEVAPRLTAQTVPRDCDLYVATGGAGSPVADAGAAWAEDFRRLCDEVVDSGRSGRGARQFLFAICYSFERVVQHFQVGRLAPRAARQFGIAPIFPTEAGKRHPLLAGLGAPFYALERRSWEVVDVDEGALQAVGGGILAHERAAQATFAEGLLAFHLGSAVEAVQFHPEADPGEVAAWLRRPEQAAMLKATYGAVHYAQMQRAATDPEGLARTYAQLIPGWLARSFNALAPDRGYRSIEA